MSEEYISLKGLAARFRHPQAYDKIGEIMCSLEAKRLSPEVKEDHVMRLGRIALSYGPDCMKALESLGRVYRLALREPNSPFGDNSASDEPSPIALLEKSMDGNVQHIPLEDLGTFADRVFHGFPFEQYHAETKTRDKRIERRLRNRRNTE